MGSELRFGNILEMDHGVVVGVGGHMEFHNDGICSEMGFGNIPELVAESCVLLQMPAMHWSIPPASPAMQPSHHPPFQPTRTCFHMTLAMPMHGRCFFFFFFYHTNYSLKIVTN